MDDKNFILYYLRKALQHTRAYSDIYDIKVDNGLVTIYFWNRDSIIVNVIADSGIAMIKDILEALEEK